MKKIAVILLIAVLIISMFSFVACNNSNQDNRTKIIIKVPALGMNIDDATSVADFLKTMAEAYMASHPDVNIEIAEYEAAKEQYFVEDTIGTSNAPDILFDSYYNMRSYVYTGYVVPLDGLQLSIEEGQYEIRQDNNAVEKEAYEFEEDAINASKINSRTYMLPFYSQQYVLAYNYDKIQSALNKAMDSIGDSSDPLYQACDNFIDNTLPTTVELAKSKVLDLTDAEWDMLLEVLAEYGDGYNYPMMMYAANTQGDSHILTMLKAQGALVTKNGAVAFNTAQGIAALDSIVDANNKGYYPDKAENFDINDCIELFMNNQLTFSICNNSLYNQYSNFGLAYFKGGVSENFYYGFEVFDNGNDEKVKIAKDFVKYIYLGKNNSKQNIYYSCCGIPAIKNVAEDPNRTPYIAFYNGFKKTLSNTIGEDVDTYKVLSSEITNWNEIRRIIQKEMQELLKGSMTSEEVAKEIDSKCAEAIVLEKAYTLHS